VSRTRPIEPPPSRWSFPDSADGVAEICGEGEVVGTGGDLQPGTILAAYRHGIFPMPVRRGVREVVAWWSPDPRGIIPIDGLRMSRSLRKSCARFEIRVDSAFDEVLAACADRRRPGAWISRDIRRAYTELHELGWVHSVEAWEPDAGVAALGPSRLVGGLYGVAIGGLFAGESMFHRTSDASKAALVALVQMLQAGGAGLLDVQWATPHLASLGATTVTRTEYHRLLGAALDRPLPAVFGGTAPP
jgi:leucyl/phenylalanyl-tRNA--protein transferase